MHKAEIRAGESRIDRDRVAHCQASTGGMNHGCGSGAEQSAADQGECCALTSKDMKGLSGGFIWLYGDLLETLSGSHDTQAPLSCRVAPELLLPLSSARSNTMMAGGNQARVLLADANNKHLAIKRAVKSGL
jgi:hypothetical protein